MRSLLKLQARFLVLLMAASAMVWADPLSLRTAAQDNNVLKYDPKNPQKPGICVEVIQAIERIDPGIKFAGWDTSRSLPWIEQRLAGGELDVFCGLIKNSEREARYGFIDVPVYTVRHRIAVRKDDAIDVTSFDDIRKLGEEGVVIVGRGTAHENYLKAQGGLRLELSSGSTDVNLRLLVGKRGRLLYHTENALLRYIEDGQLEDKVRLLPTVFKSEAILFTVSNALAPASRERLRVALTKLSQRGDLARIFVGYKEG
jgi:ABC-type amino acid transport substrate-binding protein